MRFYYQFVIPAQAGIHLQISTLLLTGSWIPAFSLWLKFILSACKAVEGRE